MDNISFQSRIRLCSADCYDKLVRLPAGKLVKYPWTYKQTVVSESAGTRDIYDCTAGGLTNGQKVMCFHLNPTDSDNNDFSVIEKLFAKKFNLSDKNLQGFLIGSKNNNINSPFSPILFDNVFNFIQKLKIPFSYFRAGNYTNHIAYSSIKDEWLIGCDLLNYVSKDVFKTPQKACEKIFDSYHIGKTDQLIW